MIRGNVLNLPGFWRGIMFVIRNIPGPAFERLEL